MCIVFDPGMGILKLLSDLRKRTEDIEKYVFLRDLQRYGDILFTDVRSRLNAEY